MNILIFKAYVAYSCSTGSHCHKYYYTTVIEARASLMMAGDSPAYASIAAIVLLYHPMLESSATV